MTEIKFYYDYYHYNSSIETVDELINTPNTILNQDVDKIKFLEYAWENNDLGGSVIDNGSQIISEYSIEVQKEKFNRRKEGGVTKYSNYKDISNIPTGTYLRIPVSMLNLEIAEVRGNNLYTVFQDYKALSSVELEKLQEREDYIKSSQWSAFNDSYRVNNIFNDCYVYCYCRAMNKLINITPFIISLNISVGGGGGSFEINFAPVVDINANFTSNSDIFNYSDYFNGDKLNENWFMRNLQMNDIFFISFEKLQMETRGVELYADKSVLPESVFDMIGLMDSVEMSYNSIINESIVSVRGRDLSKLLTDDGSYFYSLAFIDGSSERFFINGRNTGLFKRLFVSREIKTPFTYLYRSIRQSLSFIFTQLINTGVETDNDLFSYYDITTEGRTESLTKGFVGVEWSGKEIALRNLSDKPIGGVYEIIKLLVDNQLDNRRTVNDGISNPDGTLMEQCYNICQEPFVEFWGDTYGSRFVYSARIPPFTRSQIIDYIDSPEKLVVEIDSSQVSNFALSFNTDYYTWYQMQPGNAFLSRENSIGLSIFPAVLIPQYMEVFGNKKMEISSNYLSWDAINGKGEKGSVNLFRKAAINDLIYLIESTIYLPFTRKGTITIKGGDRRIKKGNWVYFKPSDEYYYVTAVANSFSISAADINRETIITVERGMKKSFVKGRDVNIYSYTDSRKDIFVDGRTQQVTSLTDGRKTGSQFIKDTRESKGYRARFKSDQIRVSYFDLVNIEEIRNRLVNFTTGELDSSGVDFIVNDDVFKFFLYKLQLDEQ